MTKQRTATLNFNDGTPALELPVLSGTVGPDVVDIRQTFSAILSRSTKRHTTRAHAVTQRKDPFLRTASPWQRVLGLRPLLPHEGIDLVN